jgi:hypothetical protein
MSPQKMPGATFIVQAMQTANKAAQNQVDCSGMRPPTAWSLSLIGRIYGTSR